MNTRMVFANRFVPPPRRSRSTMTLTRLSLCAFLLMLPIGFASGDEKSDTVKKQKAAADALLKSAKITTTHAESDDLLVYSSFSEEKTKTLAASAQKTY